MEHGPLSFPGTPNAALEQGFSQNSALVRALKLVQYLQTLPHTVCPDPS